jgi:NTE family protein
MPQSAHVPPEADAVFEGGGVKGIAFAGAIQAAEEAGVEEWKNIAGTSAGAITAALLAVGYRAAEIRKALEDTEYARFADYGFGGKYVGGTLNYLRSRGLVPGNYFREWLSDRFEEKLGKRNPTFADVARSDLPPDLSEAEIAKYKYKLKVIASDVTSGRMIVLPDHIEQYEDADGKPYVKDDFPLVDAVRMSMSYPFLFNPVTLYRERKPYYVVDGGLLSNFPIWLFDAGERPPKRPTWGFRLHSGAGPERLPYREIRRPFWARSLLKAMFFAAMEAWDREQLGRTTSARTVSIPTQAVKTTNFDLTKKEADDLYSWGYDETVAFFASPDTRTYVEAIERRRAEDEAAARAEAPAPARAGS